MAGVSSMYSVFAALHSARQAEVRRQTNMRERAYLRSLQWTDEQLAAFDQRVTGIHWRADRVLGLELCCHGVTHASCRRGCPPWPWPRAEFGLPTPKRYPPMPAVMSPGDGQPPEPPPPPPKRIIHEGAPGFRARKGDGQ